MSADGGVWVWHVQLIERGIHGEGRVPCRNPGSSQVLVSSTVKDLVAGSGLVFEDRGAHKLKGVPDEWHLYAVTGI